MFLATLTNYRGSARTAFRRVKHENRTDDGKQPCEQKRHHPHELNAVADEKGFPVYNVGMSDENDHHLTYIHLGIMASILLNSKAVDFVVTGCGTGQGALMSLNIHPGVVCGYCIDPADAFLFAQINNGNALSLPFAKGFGWGAELNVRFIFEKAFTGRNGEGYPPERKEPQVRNAGILNTVKAAVVKENYTDTLRAIDPELVKPPFLALVSSSVSLRIARIKRSKRSFARSSVNIRSV